VNKVVCVSISVADLRGNGIRQRPKVTNGLRIGSHPYSTELCHCWWPRVTLAGGTRVCNAINKFPYACLFAVWSTANKFGKL